jgi:predicted nucleic acid-binding protein
MRNSWLCVDANVVVRLVADPKAQAIQDLWERWDAEERQLAAPTLLFYEVSNALYRYQSHRLISESAARLALRATVALPVRLFGELGLHQRALDLAGRLSLPAAYDAHYLALAEWLDAEFWTADRRLVHAVQDDLPWVRGVE